jgi:5-methyltetrahydrofolate--homocysteine methyltransferase
MSEKLVDAIVNMREDEAVSVTNELIEGGEDPLKVLDACREAVGIVGKRFEEGTYFLPELIMAGEMLSKISEIVKPKLQETQDSKKAGKVLIGTVEGDIHDIGKDIVTFMLDVNGFDVLDLGIDIPPAKFVEAIKDFQPAVVGLSGFLTLAFDSMVETVKAIKDAGLRDQVKIMIGGGQIDEVIKEYTGADAYGLDAIAAVNLTKGWIEG